VIAIAGDKVVMEPTLDEAIAALFGPNGPKTAGAAAPTGPAATAPANIATASALKEARTQLDNAQDASGQGDWTKFGDAMEKLRAMLRAPPPSAQK